MISFSYIDSVIIIDRLKNISIKTQRAQAFFEFPNEIVDSEMSKLIWLVRLRWIAIALFFFMTGPGYIFGYLEQTTITIFTGVIGFLFIFNLLTQLIFVEPKKNVGPLFICFQLAFDLVALTTMLLISNGFANPFVGLFLLNAALGGVLIKGKYSIPFIILCHALLAALQINYIDVQQTEISSRIYPIMFVSHVLVFSAWLVMRSLGLYLENNFENLIKSKVLFEKQDRLRAVGALAAGFSHEFASPLTAAKLRLDRLERHLNEMNTSANILENLSEAKLSIADCENVIHSMNSSQFDVRNYNMKFVNMDEFINDVVDSWKDAHPQAKIILDIRQKNKVRISPINFAQVILNLLDNAYEAAPSVTIQIVFTKVNEEYVFIVEDNGPGFEKTILKHQGEPFVTTKEGGTGLGLYVSEIFAQSLGGRLRLENKKDKGALLTISWPESNLSKIKSEDTE